MDFYGRCLVLGNLLAWAAVSHTFKLGMSGGSLFDQLKNGADEDQKLFFKGIAPKPVTKAKHGETVVMDCEAGGSPEPTIHWLFRGARIPQGSSHNVFDDEAKLELGGDGTMKALRLGSTKARLYVDCASPEEEGEYTCVAETPEKRIVRKTELEIDLTSTAFTDSCLEGKKKRGIPARIVMWTAQRLEFEGVTVQLLCRAEGHPKPSVQWYGRNDEPIKSMESNYEILDSGDLVINGVSWMNNMGLYKCVAENQHGSDEIMTFVYPTAP